TLLDGAVYESYMRQVPRWFPWIWHGRTPRSRFHLVMIAIFAVLTAMAPHTYAAREQTTPPPDTSPMNKTEMQSAAEMIRRATTNLANMTQRFNQARAIAMRGIGKGMVDPELSGNMQEILRFSRAYALRVRYSSGWNLRKEADDLQAEANRLQALIGATRL